MKAPSPQSRAPSRGKYGVMLRISFALAEPGYLIEVDAIAVVD